MHWARFVVLSTILGATESIAFNHGELPGMRPENTRSWWRWSELSAERKLQHVKLKNSLQGVSGKGRGKKILAGLFCTNTCVILICADFVTFPLSSSGWQMRVNAFKTEGRHAEGTCESWLSEKQAALQRISGMCACLCAREHVWACAQAERTTGSHLIFNWKDFTHFFRVAQVNYFC